MTVDHRQHHLDDIRAALTLAISPLQYAVDLPAAAAHWAGDALATRTALIEENRQLHERQLLLQVRLQRLEALEAENARLRELLNSATGLADQVLIGELLAVDQDPFQRRVVINKGRSDGVFSGQPLLDAHGVMGQVIEVAPHTSTALLVTDPSHATPVQINRTGLRAIALGTGEADRMELPHIPNNADVQVGDLLVTSGLGQRFPAGYPVGTVTAVERDPGAPYAYILARPTAQLERSREVLLVLQPPAEPAEVTQP